MEDQLQAPSGSPIQEGSEERVTAVYSSLLALVLALLIACSALVQCVPVTSVTLVTLALEVPLGQHDEALTDPKRPSYDSKRVPLKEGEGVVVKGVGMALHNLFALLGPLPSVWFSRRSMYAILRKDHSRDS